MLPSLFNFAIFVSLTLARPRPVIFPNAPSLWSELQSLHDVEADPEDVQTLGPSYALFMLASQPAQPPRTPSSPLPSAASSPLDVLPSGFSSAPLSGQPKAPSNPGALLELQSMPSQQLPSRSHTPSTSSSLTQPTPLHTLPGSPDDQAQSTSSEVVLSSVAPSSLHTLSEPRQGLSRLSRRKLTSSIKAKKLGFRQARSRIRKPRRQRPGGPASSAGAQV